MGALIFLAVLGLAVFAVLLILFLQLVGVTALGLGVGAAYQTVKERREQREAERVKAIRERMEEQRARGEKSWWEKPLEDMRENARRHKDQEAGRKGT